MKTLVYFASGRRIKNKYQNLDFDKIYLIDNCFREKIEDVGKITCLKMDCLESVEYLKNKNVKIDCFVALNEGLFEGGGNYAINSDFFLGYVMPLLNQNYIHIMDKTYYANTPYRVTMDLPFEKVEINERNDRYINPLLFSNRQNAKVYQMNKLINPHYEILVNPLINIKIIHDSIWNYYDELESVVISFTQQGQSDFFDKIPKVFNLNKMQIDIGEVFNYCEMNRIRKIGFTPWGKLNYWNFVYKLKERKSDYPNEILLFHLNKNDYQVIKKQY